MPLLAHLQKHIVDPRHSNLFIGILNRVLDTYGPAVSALHTPTIATECTEHNIAVAFRVHHSSMVLDNDTHAQGDS